MSVTETSVIDIVAAQPNSPIVKLVITDHLDWDDFDTHARLLQDKVNTYIEFVESGQLSGPDMPKFPANHAVHITLAIQHKPPKQAEDFLAQVREFLSTIGISFDIEIRPMR